MLQVIEGICFYAQLEAFEPSKPSKKTHLNTDWIPLHTVEIGVVGGGCVEELPPQQLAKQGQWWTAAFPQLVERGGKLV